MVELKKKKGIKPNPKDIIYGLNPRKRITREEDASEMTQYKLLKSSAGEKPAVMLSNLSKLDLL